MSINIRELVPTGLPRAILAVAAMLMLVTVVLAVLH
jgi:hypothetical protein